jgi:hypothetical protein
MTTILLTGLPRSGTTLLCALLNTLPDSVALAEPMRPGADSPEALLAAVDAFAKAARHEALILRTVPSKLVEGELRDNFVAGPKGPKGLRRSMAATGRMRIDKELSPAFRLYIKHPGTFTFAAETLQTRYPLFALVRDPLAVLASWQTVDMNVRKGRLPASERLSPGLRTALEAIPDRLARQVEIMRWYLDIYSRLPPGRVIRFEDLTTSTETVLARLHPSPGRVERTFVVERTEARYPDVDIDRLRRALAPLAPLIARFYPG